MPVKGLDFLRNIDTSNLLPAYYLYGDRFLIDRCIEKVLEGVLSSKERETGLEVFHADSDPKAIVASALTVPFFSSKKVVVVKDTHLFKPSDLAPFVEYLRRPSPHAVLLFIGEGVDMKSRFYQLLEEQGGVVEFRAPKGRELMAWIRRTLRKGGLEITPPAVELLLEMIGDDLHALSREMEKIESFCGDKGVVDVRDIEAITPSMRPKRIFDFVDSLAEGNAGEALTTLKGLIDEGEIPQRVLGLLVRHFRVLWMVKATGIERVMARFKIPAGLISRYEREGRRLNHTDLERIYARLVVADRAIKKGLLPPSEALEVLTLDLLFLLGGGREEGVHPPGKPRYLP